MFLKVIPFFFLQSNKQKRQSFLLILEKLTLVKVLACSHQISGCKRFLVCLKSALNPPLSWQENLDVFLARATICNRSKQLDKE